MDAVLDAVERSQRGKNEARRLRATGRIPAVVYGVREGGKAIAVDPKALARILRTEQGANTLIALNLAGGGDARVLVREYQLDPITHELLHADFYRVAMDKLIRVQVTVVPQGEPKGVKQQGGVLDIVHRQIEVECLPADIPNHIEVDVVELMVGQNIRVRDLPTSGKWKAVTDAETMIMHVVIPMRWQARQQRRPNRRSSRRARRTKPRPLKLRQPPPRKTRSSTGERQPDWGLEIGPEAGGWSRKSRPRVRAHAA
jgi:large subunit ribosomal protein L25